MLFSLSIQAQDWCSWSFQYDFKIESNGRGKYQFDSLEVSINDPFQSTRLQKSSLYYNDSTKVYSLNLSYGCVSCGYQDKEHPPTTFFKLYLYDDFLNQNIAIIIPLTFDTINLLNKFTKPQPPTNNILLHIDDAIYFDLGTIIYEDFIFFNSSFNQYEGIRVKPNGEIFKYKKGTYLYPVTEKLIKVNYNN